MRRPNSYWLHVGPIIPSTYLHSIPHFQFQRRYNSDRYSDRIEVVGVGHPVLLRQSVCRDMENLCLHGSSMIMTGM